MLSPSENLSFFARLTNLLYRLNSFQKPLEFQSASIFFSFAHPWHLLFLLCYFNLPLKF